MGIAGHEFVNARFSNRVMIGGYELLIEGIYQAACLGTKFMPQQLDDQLSAFCKQDAELKNQEIGASE
jgi:hypothetical protein